MPLEEGSWVLRNMRAKREGSVQEGIHKVSAGKHGQWNMQPHGMRCLEGRGVRDGLFRCVGFRRCPESAVARLLKLAVLPERRLRPPRRLWVRHVEIFRSLPRGPTARSTCLLVFPA
ncbi:unnamed protein product [Symbiodinium sp. CCMP2456]|nr:unnamed protein product [Symbiodinium sp. CCMP2456]